MNTIADEVTEVMRKRHGRDISLYNSSFVTRTFEGRLAIAAIQSPSDYLSHLSENRGEADAFFRSLTISYSEFFRNPLTFDLLGQTILPRLADMKEKSGNTEIRVWSAGCAAGQEAYSIAILLEELAATRAKVIPFRIFATDISEAELEVGRRGVYDEAPLKNVKLRHLNEYFVRQGETYTVVPRLRDRVDFSVYDLLDEDGSSPPACIFGDFDLIFCSNLLFYYRQGIRQVILTKMQQCLSSNGYLVVSEAERGIVEEAHGFQAIAPPAVVFQKIRHSRGNP